MVALAVWFRRIRSWPGVLLILAALLLLYFTALRPWMAGWGATAAERAMPLPGDELKANPNRITTRAITIEAPAGEVWGWLVQIGTDRAGFYSYDWLENLTGAGIHNTNRIHPEWQQRRAGDFIPAVQEGWLGGIADGKAGWEVPVVEPGRTLVLANWGAFVVIPVDADTTRLIARSRTGDAAANAVEQLGAELFGLGMDPIHFVMERQMLKGIKARAEGRPLVPGPLGAAARAGWVLGAAAVGALLLRRPTWLALPLVPAALILLSTGDAHSALAAFLATGITVAGALRWGRSWWPPFALLAAAVLLILLFAPEAYVAFGHIFFAAVMLGVARWLTTHRHTLLPAHSYR